MTPSHAYHVRALNFLRGVAQPRDADVLKEMRRFRKQHAGWLKSPEVFGTSIGYRQTAGKTTSDLAIRVHVARKLANRKGHAAWIPPTLRVPGMSQAVAVDVIERGVIKVQASCGDAIGCVGVPAWGTLGCTVVSSDSDLPDGLLALTCSHVLTLAAGGGVNWLGYPGALTNPAVRLGSVVYRTQLVAATAEDAFPNLYEIAFAQLADFDVDNNEHTLGVPTGWRMDVPAMGESLRLFGACSGAISGTVTATPHNHTVEIDGAVYGFSNMIEHNAPSQPGDSGAAVLDAANRIVGLHLGVDSLTGNAVLMPIAPIVRRYRLQLPPIKPIATATQAGNPVAVSSRAEAIDVLARTIWGEARSEPSDGMIAVANVVINRVRCRRTSYGLTVEAVCQKPYQFSCWNANDPNLPKLTKVASSDPEFVTCLDIARRAVSGTLADLTSGSCHYHTRNVSAEWSNGHVPVYAVGSHLFYNDIP